MGWNSPADPLFRRFAEWVEQSGIERDRLQIVPSNVRVAFCISVDTESLASIRTGPQLPDRDTRGKTWVNLINGFPRDDKARSRGWMRLGTFDIAPRAYALLTVLDWDDSYVLPPKVAEL